MNEKIARLMLHPANKYMLKVNNKNTRKSVSQQYGVFIVNFKHNSHLFSVFLLLTLNS